MGFTSMSMHREVQIKHDSMTHKCKMADGLRHETSGLCDKTNCIYIVLPLVVTKATKCPRPQITWTWSLKG